LVCFKNLSTINSILQSFNSSILFDCKCKELYGFVAYGQHAMGL